MSGEPPSEKGQQAAPDVGSLGALQVVPGQTHGCQVSQLRPLKRMHLVIGSYHEAKANFKRLGRRSPSRWDDACLHIVIVACKADIGTQYPNYQ